MKNKWYHRIISAALSLVILLGVVVLGTDRINAAAETVTYQSHVQDIGWQGWVSNGTVSGTSGQSKRLEAIQIRLTGAAADTYDVYYHVHAENYGWLGWARNGEPAGTAGFGYRLEAIKVVLVPKGGAAPGTTARAFVQG